jgi:hypothetical protein
MSHRDYLDIPDAVRSDPDSFELLRVWIAHGGQHVTLRTGGWDDPAAWGIMLADVARHVANAYHQEKGLDRAASLERIKAGLYVEFESPTDEPTGGLVS